MAPGVVQADASNPAQRQANAARFVSDVFNHHAPHDRALFGGKRQK
jgi:hypothetical protein